MCGSVDGLNFKNFVLGTLFYRFISENFFKKMTNNTVLKDELIIDIFDKKENIDHVTITLAMRR